MNKLHIVTLGAAVAALASAGIAMAYPGQQLAPHAKVSIAQARTIALHAVNGKIVSEELETERGGSGLRYSFDVKTAQGVREVGVDAKSGAVLENSSDNGGEQGEAPESGHDTEDAGG